MLHLETLEPATFTLLNELMQVKELQDCCLVGGTALALMYGHRRSVDLDLFTPADFNKEQIVGILSEKYADRFSYTVSKTSWGIFGFIDDVKIDIVRYDHTRIYPLLIEDEIRMYDPRDIAAMKIAAVYGRGQKKDFFDIYQLLQIFTLENLIDFYRIKFPSQQLLISIPTALTYFEDAEESEDPVSLVNVGWNTVKDFICQTVSDYLK